MSGETERRGLAERTVDYGIAVMELCEKLPHGFAARHVAGQLIRSATSVAANYAEATGTQGVEGVAGMAPIRLAPFGSPERRGAASRVARTRPNVRQRDIDRLWAGATVERANALLTAGFWLLVVETLPMRQKAIPTALAEDIAFCRIGLISYISLPLLCNGWVEYGKIAAWKNLKRSCRTSGC